MEAAPATTLRVLHVASECYPLVKTGGLADVVGALPLALRTLGVASTVLLPAYPSVIRQLPDATKVADLPDLFGGPASLRSATTESGLDLLLIDAPHLYERPGGPYLDENGHDWPDNDLRFGALSWVAAQLALGELKWRGNGRPVFDVLHLHDWQAALTTAYLRYHPAVVAGTDTPLPTLLTIHNLAFQGNFPRTALGRLRLPPEAGEIDALEFWGGISFLKAGVQWATTVSTVSPTYAREILSPEFGMGFDGLLRARGDEIIGIVNGLDTDVWNPATDPFLSPPYEHYSADHLRGKAACKRALQHQFGLTDDPDAPLFAVVSRLTHQKGIDLLLNVLPTVIERGAQFAILGTGEHEIETALRSAADHHPRSVAITIGFDEELAHHIHAGADAILVPSRFEPCGLTQLSGLRYGAVPIVARVGGLADTVIDANDAAMRGGVATGLQFSPIEQSSLAETSLRAIRLFHDKSSWVQVQRHGMNSRLGWNERRPQYAAALHAAAHRTQP